MNNGCKLCGMGVGYEPELSGRKMADKYDVAKSSVQRHRKHLMKDKGAAQALQQASAAPLAWEEIDDGSIPGDDFFKDIPEKHITARGASIRDPETGSWYKASWKPNAVALHEALKYDDLADLLSEPIVHFYDLDNRSDHAEIFCPTDTQIGKASQRGGGTPETIETVKEATAEFIQNIRITKPETVIIADGGDPIENIFNVKGQKWTNDLSLTEQIRTARRLFAWIIKQIAPEVPNVIFLSVPSNHGAVRDGEGRDSQAGTVDADFGLEINHSLEDEFADREAYTHVRFVRPDPLEETAVIDVSGTRIAFHHGHQSGGIHKHSDWWAKQSHGRRPGWDADIFVFGHWHTPNIGQSGNGRWIVSVTSSEPGSDWYTNKTGESSVKGVTSFAVKNGKWFNYAIRGMRAPK